MMLKSIKQHLSNIWSSIHEKVKQHWHWVEKKSVAYKKSVYYSFKKKYTVNNLGLLIRSKRFLCAAVGARVSTHDARLSKSASIFNERLNKDY